MCTTRLAGSEDYDTFCAVKTDGRLSCWDRDGWYNQEAMELAAGFDTGPTTRIWRQVAVWDGPFGACAVDDAGQVLCQGGLGGQISSPSSDLEFSTFAPTTYGNYGLLTDQQVFCSSCKLTNDFLGAFSQIVPTGFDLYGIDVTGQLHGPAYQIGAFPPGRYTFLAVNNNLVCAVRDDARIFCNPIGLPPPDDAGYLQVAMNHDPGNACALRSDGRLVCWAMRPNVAVVSPPDGTFTAIAASDTAFCAIRTDGTTACWTTLATATPPLPPPGW